MRFSGRMVPEVYQTFWAGMAARCDPPRRTPATRSRNSAARSRIGTGTARG